MTDSLLSRIQDVDGDTLTPIVRRATGCSGPLTHWEYVPIKVWVGGLGQNVIYRFTGRIQDLLEEKTWSLVLKVTSPALPGKGPQPKKTNDYRREYEFYRSDLGQFFPAGFRSARCYAQDELMNEEGLGEYWLWLEDLAPYVKNIWGLEDHYQAALALGKFNGVFLMNHPLRTAPWMKENHVQQYLEQAAPSFQRLFKERDQPILRRLFPPAEVDSLAELWQRREDHLEIIKRIPHTLCHGDAQFTNLFLLHQANGDVETAAIDWESTGMAPIGMDLAPALMMNLFKIDEISARALDQALFEGYLEGLRAIGWHGDARMVRLGFTSAILRVRATYVVRPLSFLTDEGISELLQHWLKEWGVNLEGWADRWSWIHGYLRGLFEESLALKEQLF